ncbi:MAG: hypothetical protein QXG39_00315 [Candidatus Aenigmatarchaeota archaeon]
MILLVITNKWEEVSEVKFRGKARLVGEIEKDGKEFLVWQFYGDEEELAKTFRGLEYKIIKINNGGEKNGK